MSDDYDPTDTTEKTPLIPGGGGNDDDDDDEWSNVDLSQQEIPEAEAEQWRFPPDTDPNTTQPFKAGASSTPSGSEKIPMTTRLPPEKQGASGGTAETSFITGVDQGRRVITLENMARMEIEGEFPNASPTELDFLYRKAPKSGGHIFEVKYHTSDTWYPLYTKSPGDLAKTLNTSLPKRIKDALVKSKSRTDDVDDAIDKTNAALQDLQKQEETQRNELQKAGQKAAEAQRLRREMDDIRGRTTDVENHIQELEDTQGPLDETAIQKLKDEKRKLESDHKAKRKQLDAVAKAAQQARKLQQDINKTILSKGETERRLGKLKGQKDAIQPLDELKQKAAELNQQIIEDLRII